MGNTYTAGTSVRLQAQFTDFLSGFPVNPTTTLLKYAITVNGAQQTPVTISSLLNPQTGLFQYVLDTTNNPGYYTYEFIGQGVGQAAGASSFLVEPLPI